MSRTIFSLVPLLLLCSPPGNANPSPAGNVIDVGSKKQLFIDDLFVESRHGVRLTVNPPRKTRERNLVPGPDRAYFVFPSAYYHFVGESARRNDGTMDIQLAVSRDGIHFSRPSRSPFVRRGRSIPGPAR